MSSGTNKASTSIDKKVGIGKEEGPKKNYDTVCEENTTENGNGKLPAPFKLASEHNNTQGGMQNGVKEHALQWRNMFLSKVGDI
jgi:hypothetical protein